MSEHWKYLRCARIVVEATTPLSVATGSSDQVLDTSLVHDANGLPTIPATSLKGVLRSLFAMNRKMSGDEAAGESENGIFGYVDGVAGAPARIRITDGLIHDCRDIPVDGLLMPYEPSPRFDDDGQLTDEVLKALLELAAEPIVRDRVRLNGRGVSAASEMGKFDRSVIPRGTRFTFDVSLWSRSDQAEADDPVWRELLSLFASPLFRVGGLTRSGLGRLEVIRAQESCYDLSDIAEYERFRKDSDAWARLDATAPGSPVDFSESGLAAGLKRWKLDLQPDDLWRIGQGTFSANSVVNQRPEQSGDALPRTEAVIHYDEHELGALQDNWILVPASSVKGALRHRVAFHYACITGNYVAPDGVADLELAEHSAAVRTLFGTVAGHGKGNPGRIFMNDLLLPPLTGGGSDARKSDGKQHVSFMPHNTIDRFSGGVLGSRFFSEELLYRIEIPGWTIDVLPPDDPDMMAALEWAIDDLISGRLGIGAGGGKGHGYFSANSGRGEGS